MPLSWAFRLPEFEHDLFNPDEYDEYVHAAGAYVLVATRQQFTYPLGASRVFYIGMADQESLRLTQHRYWATRARADFWENERFSRTWDRRYTYAARFGARVCWYTRRGRQSPRQLEALLVRQFYQTFGSIPATNGQWPMRRR